VGVVKALIACEESQIVTKEFRKLRHEAYSCDILPCSGGHPEWHFQCDVREILEGFYKTPNSLNHFEKLIPWDIIIAFPPCTDIAGSGARWFKEKRADGRQQRAIEFFMLFTKLSCPKVSIESPVGIMSTIYKKPTQYIQPWEYGHGETKKTCLWLKGLPKLIPTNKVDGREQRIWRMPPSDDRGMLRSKTYQGVAEAMATQWSNC
jgi:hypothetical protein